MPDPTPTVDPPVKPRKRITWGMFVTAVVICMVIAFLVIPHFVKAKTTECKNACIANLKQIDGAVQQWALEHKKGGTNTATISDILPFMKGSALPPCPDLGVYSVSTVSGVPTYTFAARGHLL